MIFEKHIISSKLNKYIDSIVYFKDFNPIHSIERVIPTGQMFIIFEFDNMTREILDNNSLKQINKYSKVWISGLHFKYISISAHSKSEMLVIQFTSVGVFPFLHIQAHELNGLVINGENIFGQGILDLREKILEVDDVKIKFELIENWLLNRFDESKIPPDYFVKFVDSIINTPLSLSENLKKYPFTQKQLIHNFKKYIGITPKYFQRIIRFNEILKIIQRKEHVSWTNIAYRCEYYDQSHFIKEFYHFSGFNPQEFVEMGFAKDETNFFPLN